MDITLITGCEKTGTSFTAGLLHCLGLFGGDISDLIVPRCFNKKGGFENQSIKLEFIKPYLLSRGLFNHKRMPNRFVGKSIDWFDLPMSLDPLKLRSGILDLFKGEGWDGNQPLFLKSPAFVRMPREMSEAFPEAKWVFVRRDAQGAMRSRYAKRYTHAKPDSNGHIEVDDIYRMAMESMDQIKDHVGGFNFSPNDVINGNIKALESLSEYVGGVIDKASIDEWVDPSMWNVETKHWEERKFDQKPNIG
jgi:hypothetical protein